MKIETYHIITVLGECIEKLPFLTDKQQGTLNLIGYSGKLGEVKTSREQYLNSLNIGTFKVEQTKFDNGDFKEKFDITRVIEQ